MVGDHAVLIVQVYWVLPPHSSCCAPCLAVMQHPVQSAAAVGFGIGLGLARPPHLQNGSHHHGRGAPLCWQGQGTWVRTATGVWEGKGASALACLDGMYSGMVVATCGALGWWCVASTTNGKAEGIEMHLRKGAPFCWHGQGTKARAVRRILGREKGA